MLISPEEYELLVQFTEWMRSQNQEWLDIQHSEEIVVEFLDEDEVS